MELRAVVVAHLLLDAIRTEATHAAAHEQARLVYGIAERLARVAEHDKVAGLRHEGAEMAHRALDDDVDAFHRDAAARRGVAIDNQHAAAPARSRGLAGIALHMHVAGHHVLGHAGAGAALDDHGGAFVHPGTVIADMSLDIDRHRGIEPDGDGMPAFRIQNAPVLVGIRRQRVELLVQVTELGLVEIENSGVGARAYRADAGPRTHWARSHT